MASYFKLKSLLTNTELLFYGSLSKAVPENCVVFSKVRLYDVIQPYAGYFSKEKAKIIQKHLDFLVCDAETLEPLIAIELDDPSHQNNDRVERDHFINQSLFEAGLRLLRIPAQRHYDKEKLQSDLKSVLLSSVAHASGDGFKDASRSTYKPSREPVQKKPNVVNRPTSKRGVQGILASWVMVAMLLMFGSFAQGVKNLRTARTESSNLKTTTQVQESAKPQMQTPVQSSKVLNEKMQKKLSRAVQR